ncbi:MAG: chloramphenicol resistance protein [Clostridiales Family XIII bacterium]|jgi:hypothetical protein|nr:chloramphenicol resistance protein [Clostridiales Family XIII bacterium]
MTNILEALREHVKGFPGMPGFYRSIGVDYLEEEPDAYMLEAVPAKPVVKSYVNGDTHRQLVFVLSSRESYGPDVGQALAANGFYQSFAEWLDRCTREGDLPDLGTGREALRLEALTGGYAFATGVRSARYQIQCRLLYFEKGDLQ